MTQTLEYRAAGAAASLFRSRAPEVLIEGPAGTGKTRAVLEYLNYLCEAYAGVRILICRQTRVSLTESVLVTWESKVLWQGHPALSGSDASRANRHSFRYPNRSEVIVGGLDNPDRIMSTEYDVIYVAEATEANEEAIEKLASRLRNHVLPWQQLICDCNPAAPGHWLNKRAARGQMVRLLSRHRDNPSLTPEYLERLANLTGHRRARLFEGRWVAAEGSVFGAEFDRARNVCKSFPIPEHWPTVYYNDNGYDHPNGGFWLAISPTNRRFLCDEIYVRQTPIADDPETGRKGIATLIKEVERERNYRPYKRFMDPGNGFSHTQYATNGTTLAEQMEKEGLYFMAWPRLQGTAKDAGVNQVRTGFTSGQLVIFDRCVNAIQEVEAWSYKRNSQGEQLSGDDQYVDAGNEIIDGLIGAEVNGHTYAEGNPAPAPPEPYRDDDEPEDE